jgi:hypothetical protein
MFIVETTLARCSHFTAVECFNRVWYEDDCERFASGSVFIDGG